MPDALFPSTAAPPNALGVRPGRRFLFGLLAVQVVNLLCALLITGLQLTGAGFGLNLLFSVCIGSLAYSFINGGRILLWGAGNKPPLLPFLALVLLGLFLAQLLGTLLASVVSGVEQPARHLAGGAPMMLVLTLAAGGISSWLFWNRGRLAWLQAQAEAEKARAAAIEKQAVQAQLQLLQAQIEPHMLFNTLANLQGLISLDPARAQVLLEQLIQYLRATLSSSRAASASLRGEFELVAAYLGLMQVRMGERLRYRLDLPPELSDLNIPPMLLQPLVENAVKHGLEPKLEGGSITISARLENSMLLLQVRDDGLGLEYSNTGSTRGTGLGLANIRERVERLYGPQGRLTLAPASPGTVATLCLPLP